MNARPSRLISVALGVATVALVGASLTRSDHGAHETRAHDYPVQPVPFTAVVSNNSIDAQSHP